MRSASTSNPVTSEGPRAIWDSPWRRAGSVGSVHAVTREQNRQSPCLQASGQGLCCSALFVIAWPVADRSWPAPAVVLQAPKIGAAAISRRNPNAIEAYLRMFDIL